MARREINVVSNFQQKRTFLAHWKRIPTHIGLSNDTLCFTYTQLALKTMTFPFFVWALCTRCVSHTGQLLVFVLLGKAYVSQPTRVGSQKPPGFGSLFFSDSCTYAVLRRDRYVTIACFARNAQRRQLS